jgi:hypothetical protein
MQEQRSKEGRGYPDVYCLAVRVDLGEEIRL